MRPWSLILPCICACHVLAAQPTDTTAVRIAEAPNGGNGPSTPRFWLDLQGGIASTGFVVGGSAHLMLKPLVLTLGMTGISDKALSGMSFTEEWQELRSFHALASYAHFPARGSTVVSVGAGAGVAFYHERRVVDDTGWPNSTLVYEELEGVVLDIPIAFKADFFADAPLGLLIAMQAHLNSRTPSIGLVVGIRFANILPAPAPEVP